MATDKVTIFRPHALQAGQKIRIESGPRGGDWEVVGVTERTVRLRCPISNREVEWDRFCYFVEERDDIEWPQRD
jgi:hypothetical protein